MKRLAFVIPFLLAACGGAAPQGARPAAGPQNVLLITIDTLRADRLNASTMPNVDAFAAGAIRFANARAVVPLTLPSHTALMTGARPAVTGVRTNGVAVAAADSRPRTLARVLHDAGYRTGAFVGAYVLDRRFGLADGFDVYDDHVDRDPTGAPRLEAERRGDRVVDAALMWLRASDAQKPFFAWVHLYDPHAPYDPPPEFLARAGRRAYDGEVMFADAQAGRLLTWLRESGIDGRTLVVIAGDHGEGLGDHGEQTHGMLAYDSTLRVPLVMREPGVAARTITTPVSLLDVAGTVLALVHVGPPKTMSAASMLGDQAPRETFAETQYPRAAGWHSLAVVADDRWKIIASSETELYDLSTDPEERHNLSESRTALAASMRQRAMTLSTAAARAMGTPSDAEERLRALGYVSSGAMPADTDQAPNPAAQIYAWNTFERELGRVSEGHARAALPGLANLARSYPDAPVIQSTYARALKDAGRVQTALDIYRRAVAKWPDDPVLFHDLAVAAAAAGLSAEAARAEQAALALDPANPLAANGLGLLAIDAGRPADAVQAFERAVAADPGNAVYWTNLGNARREAGNAAGAERAYRAALERDGRAADASNGIGVLLVQAHQPADAIPWFNRALAAQPDFTDARLNLGIAYQQAGQPERAAEQYTRVLAAAQPGSRTFASASSLLAGLKR